MKAFLKGKRVAVVGRAGSILGTGHGPAIDAHPYVIRVNALLPLPEDLAPDLGARTDLVYTCLNCSTARVLADAAGVPFRRMSARRRKAVTRKHFAPGVSGIRASTGLVCVADVLRWGARRVDLYGFDLMRSEHWQERSPDGHDPSGKKDGSWVHDWEQEAQAWRRLIAKSGRVRPDPIFRAVLYGPKADA